MKTTIKQFITAFLLSVCLNTYSQNPGSKTTLALLSIDTKEVGVDPVSMGNMVRIELEKLDTFGVVDKYEIQQYTQQNNVSLSNCFGKACLIEVGKNLKSDKVLSGSVEKLGKTITFTYRLIDVETGELEKTYVREFLNIPEELQNMAKLSIAEMLNHPFDKNLMNKLSKRYEFDNSNNNPNVDLLCLEGPRMGFASFTGQLQNIVKGKKSEGGFDLYPVMFQFGYQFEKQYLNEGKVQALFEFIPMITGLDQGHFLPSVTLMHGIRSNVNGWEFAFGPSFNIIKMGKGYYDSQNQWHLKNEWNEDPEHRGIENPFETKERMDSRGYYKLGSYFILAAGRTFKSGRLNIPVNAYVIPGRYGWRFGVSFGFNGKNKY